MLKNINKATITILTSDLDVSISFYTNIIGLELIQNYGGHYAEIQAPGFRIGLHPTDGDIRIGNNMSVGLGVSDFDAEVQNLAESGVRSNVTQDGPIRLAHFNDPDGNPLYLAELADDG